MDYHPTSFIHLRKRKPTRGCSAAVSSYCLTVLLLLLYFVLLYERVFTSMQIVYDCCYGFIRHNPNMSHRRQVRNPCHTNNISYVAFSRTGVVCHVAIFVSNFMEISQLTSVIVTHIPLITESCNLYWLERTEFHENRSSNACNGDPVRGREHRSWREFWRRNPDSWRPLIVHK
jgi:hypothetical protein